MSEVVDNNTVVTMHLTMSDPVGNVLDSTRDNDEPMVYIHGSGVLLPELEKRLTGQAFGHVDPELTQQVPEGAFEGVSVTEGMIFDSQSDSLDVRTVTKIENGMVHLDANHPMAGKTLDFDIEILGIRPATEVEIEQGHL
jgi:FKBP-type peptidyl-prolyl cis-trans isomerase SlyD